MRLLFLIILTTFVAAKVDLHWKIAGHRGYPYKYPEHTIRGFSEAILGGADFVETDIHLSADLQPIIIHDAYLDGITDCRSRSSCNAKATSRQADGSSYEDKVFTSDLTLSELKELRQHQRFPDRSKEYDGKLPLVSLEELIQTTIALNAENDTKAGIFVEIKSPEYHTKYMGESVNEHTLALIRRYKLDDPSSEEYLKCPIVVISFSTESLEYWSEHSKVPLIQLMGWGTLYDLDRLKPILTAIGPDASFLTYDRVDPEFYFNGQKYSTEEDFIREVIKPGEPEDSLEKKEQIVKARRQSKLVEWANENDLAILPWTLRVDRHEFSKDVRVEFEELIRLGFNSFITDNYDLGLEAINKH